MRNKALDHLSIEDTLAEMKVEIQSLHSQLELLENEVYDLKRRPSIIERLWNRMADNNLPIISYTDDLRFSIDSFKISNGKIYGYGWAFHKKSDIKKIQLLEYRRGSTQFYPVQYGNQRVDVATDHPEFKSEYSGFLISCHISKGKAKLYLEIWLNDETKQIIPIETVKGRALTRTSIYKRKTIKLIKYLLQGRFSELITKSRESIQAVHNSNANPLFKMAHFNEVIKEVNALPFLLIFDHKMGGGANLYRQRLIQEKRKNIPVIHLFYDLPSLEYGITYYYKDDSTTFALDSIETIVSIIQSKTVNFSEIFVNNLVSFDLPIFLTKFILNLKVLCQAKLTVPIHDYFCICPSFTLQDYKGDFCGIPDLDKCRDCLPKNKGEFRHIVNFENIDSWRYSWNLLLQHSDHIICFSRSSYDYVMKAYPDLNSDRIQIIPHTVDYLPEEKLEISANLPVNVGVLGNISEIKGASIIRKMVELVESQRLPVKITVIGRMGNIPKSDCLHVTGEYKHSELKDLIEKTGVNIGFVPSIVPETFCYVVNEFMHFELPVVSFSLGAQAERVSKYSKGLIISEMTPSVILQKIIKFHQQLYLDCREEEIV